MKRLAIALTLLLIVVVTAESASAECAWVLWNAQEHQVEPGPLVEHGHRYETLERVEAYESKQECRSGLEKRLDSAKKFPFFTVVGDAVWQYQVGTKPLRDSTYTCWPDTVDPRGPKGK